MKNVQIGQGKKSKKPKLGDIRKTSDFPFRSHSYVWMCCPICGTPRWVQLCYGKPVLTGKTCHCWMKKYRGKNRLPLKGILKER